VLCLGIGGGGDVVGATATAELIRARGREAVVGGTTWERTAIDPQPGPRRLDEVVEAERIAPHVALAGPATATRDGVRFAEARLAEALDEPVVLVDVHNGPDAIAGGIAAAADHLDCDLIVLLDVGGDVLAHGDEPGLGSPLCDSIVVAGTPALVQRGPVALAVFGVGCDGELTPDEVMARVAEVWAAGGSLGTWGLTPEAVARLQTLVEAVPTEASAQALACARGELGRIAIRGGRRHVERSPLGALTFFLDPLVTLDSAARLAKAVGGATSLEDANDRLHDLGVSTELDWERRTAGG
jgi:hypothetical protein